MKLSHSILCSAAAAAVLVAGCQSAEEREAGVERDAFAQLVDEVEGTMNEELTLIQTLWDIEVEYERPRAFRPDALSVLSHRSHGSGGQKARAL